MQQQYNFNQLNMLAR